MSEYKLNPHGAVTRLSDGASIPADPANTDYAAYLVWVASGGVADPVDPPSQRDTALSQIAALEASVTQRRIREAALTDTGKSWLAEVDAKIAALRGATA